MSFQMSPQIAFLGKFRFTLAAFMQFYSHVDFEMCPQISFLNRCIVALAAFVWFFSRMSSQMSLQIPYPNRCIVALAAFVRFFSRKKLHRSSQIACFIKINRQRCVHSEDKLLTGFLFLSILEELLPLFHFHCNYPPSGWQQPAAVSDSSFPSYCLDNYGHHCNMLLFSSTCWLLSSWS